MTELETAAEPTTKRVLVIEDDAAIRTTTSRALGNFGLDVSSESDGRQGLIRFRREPFDVVLLDIMLPSLDGIEICRQIRQDSIVPVIMLTARTDTSDVVRGLEAGADDYVTKPFDIEELVARIRAALRRAENTGLLGKIRVGPLEVDPFSFRATKSDKPIALTATEFRLLLELVKARGRVLTREILLETVWGYDHVGDSRLVDMAVNRLRSKIEDDPSEPQLVETVRGIGYRLGA